MFIPGRNHHCGGPSPVHPLKFSSTKFAPSKITMDFETCYIYIMHILICRGTKDCTCRGTGVLHGTCIHHRTPTQPWQSWHWPRFTRECCASASNKCRLVWSHLSKMWRAILRIISQLPIIRVTPNTPQTQGATEVNAPIAPLATTSLTWYFHRWTEFFNNTNTTNKHHIPSIGATCCKSHQHHHFRPWHLASCLQQPVQSSPQSFHPLAAAVPNSAAKSRKAMVGAVHGGVNHVVKNAAAGHGKDGTSMEK